jgi:hypothetical protein
MTLADAGAAMTARVAAPPRVQPEIVGPPLPPPQPQQKYGTGGMPEFEAAVRAAQRSASIDEQRAPQMRLSALIQRYTQFPGSLIGSSNLRYDPVKEIYKGLFVNLNPQIVGMADQIPVMVMSQFLREAANPIGNKIVAPIPVAPLDPYGMLSPAPSPGDSQLSGIALPPGWE